MAQYSEPNIQGIVKPRFPGSFAGVTEIQDQHEPNIIGVDQSHFPGTKSPRKILELNFEGPDQSTSIIDTSPFARTATLIGSPKLSTINPIQGSSSLVLNGTSDYIMYGATSDFALGSDDFYFSLRFSTISSKFMIIGGTQADFLLLLINGKPAIYSTKINFSQPMSQDISLNDGLPHLLELRKYNNSIELSIDRRVINKTNPVDCGLQSTWLCIGGYQPEPRNFEGMIDNLLFLK